MTFEKRPFSFLEGVIGNLSNRGKYGLSKEVIQQGFHFGKQQVEHWQGMYLTKEDNPTEDSALFGNLRFECDEEDFSVLRAKTLVITEFLSQKYGIKHWMYDMYLTNRSIWLSIPAKLFGCFGMKNLHLVHKEMAREVNDVLLNAGYEKGLDLSIYRWNGLTRTLGSYLKSSNRRVVKFDYSQLEDSYTAEDLIQKEFDNNGSYSELQVLRTAKKWFDTARKRLENRKKNSNKINSKEKVTMHEGMLKFIKNGEMGFNRNLHTYSVALFLKDIGYDVDQAIEKIQNSFSNTYVQSTEAVRTIKSAFKGDKHFAPSTAKDYLDSSIFEGHSAETEEKKTFIIPRSFIESLHKLKAHYNAYKLLFKILHTYQTTKEFYVHDLSNDKYKKNTLAHFEKLVEAGLISYTLKGDSVETKLIHQDRSIYHSYIIVPANFMKRKLFKKMKKEFVLLVELWRASIKHKEEKMEFHFNMLTKTILGNLKMTKKTFISAWAKLVSYGFVTGNCVKPEGSAAQVRKERKKEIKKKFDENRVSGSTMVNSTLDNEYPVDTGIEVYCSTPSVNPFVNTMKCNYSIGIDNGLEALIHKGLHRISESNFSGEPHLEETKNNYQE